MTFTHSCPSCSAPLDDDGVCTACGALSRGFFRDLDLGTPQIAAAVTRGLDFYRLLDVDRHATIHTIARRYRRLRVLFPDNPSSLAPEPARKLALLEMAGRVLTDPALRAHYDTLRATGAPGVQAGVLRCTACGAPLRTDAPRCAYCGTPHPVEPLPPAAPPESGPLAAEPADYYALLGVAPAHLMGPENRPVTHVSPRFRGAHQMAGAAAMLRASQPPTPEEVDAASYARQRELLLTPGLAPEQRDARITDLEIARRVLRDDRLRDRYDSFWRALRHGRFERGHFEGLRALIDEVRESDTASTAPPVAEGAAFLQQGLGLLAAGLPREALQSLQRARAALPQSAEAHAAFVRATLASADPLDLGAHALRQALAAIEAAEHLGAPLPDGPALAALCRGLLARDAADGASAEAACLTATQLDPSLGAAWRALAALTLGRGAVEEAASHCHRALAIDPRDERALLMLAGVCLRAQRPAEARVAAERVAALRGPEASADDVLSEIGG